MLGLRHHQLWISGAELPSLILSSRSLYLEFYLNCYSLAKLTPILSFMDSAMHSYLAQAYHLFCQRSVLLYCVLLVPSFQSRLIYRIITSDSFAASMLNTRVEQLVFYPSFFQGFFLRPLLFLDLDFEPSELVQTFHAPNAWSSHWWLSNSSSTYSSSTAQTIYSMA